MNVSQDHLLLYLLVNIIYQVIYLFYYNNIKGTLYGVAKTVTNSDLWVTEKQGYGLQIGRSEPTVELIQVRVNLGENNNAVAVAFHESTSSFLNEDNITFVTNESAKDDEVFVY